MNCKVLNLATDVFEPCISEDRQTVRHCLSTSEDLTLIQRQAKEKSSQNLALRPDLSAVSKSSRHDATTAATPRKTLLSRQSVQALKRSLSSNTVPYCMSSKRVLQRKLSDIFFKKNNCIFTSSTRGNAAILAVSLYSHGQRCISFCLKCMFCLADQLRRRGYSRYRSCLGFVRMSLRPLLLMIDKMFLNVSWLMTDSMIS